MIDSQLATEREKREGGVGQQYAGKSFRILGVMHGDYV